MAPAVAESSKLLCRVLPRNHIDELRAAVGADGLITDESQLQTYECDGLTNFRVLPGGVVLPRMPRAGAGGGSHLRISTRFPL